MKKPRLQLARTPGRDALIGILIGILLGFLFSNALSVQGNTVEQKSTPFQTHANMLLVRVVLNRTQTPRVERVEKLDTGRVTIVAPGANTLQLHDDSGNLLYSQSFDARFVRASEPPEIMDSLVLVFVVPYNDKVKRVLVMTPNGSADFTLE